MLRVGIVGLPNAGKSTIFNALTGGHAPVASYPFTTVDPNVGVVAVPDPRLEGLARAVHPHLLTPATVEFVDIAGLVKGAHRGEGLGNQFLAKIREVDALCHVVRCFEDPEVAHVAGSLDPVEDLSTVSLELALADLEVVERRRERARHRAKVGEPGLAEEVAALAALRETLGRGIPVRRAALEGRAREILAELFLLTAKPLLFVANIGERDVATPDAAPGVPALGRAVAAEGAALVVICGKLEAELAQLPPAERAAYAREWGLGEPGLPALIREGYRALGLITFYTIKGEETRAWALPRGSTAPEAAGKIHSDMERGFVRAEVVHIDHFLAAGSLARAREAGHVRSEGREYIVQDGDILLIRFTP